MIQTRYAQPYSDSLYQRKLQDFLSGKADGNELFSIRCQMFREQAPEQTNELLFIPVGLTFQGPILASLAAPSKEIYLLCSRDSWDTGGAIVEALKDDFVLHRVKINPVDGNDIADKVQAIYESHGCPAQVVCDQTGGQKPTTSTLAGLAALNGWRLLYIESTHQEKKIHSERPLWLPNLFDTFGGVHRLVARSCALRGALEAAAAEINLAIDSASVSGPLLAEQKEIRRARLFRQGDADKFARSLEKKAWATELAVVQRNPQALRYWMLRCLWKEGQTLAAEGLAARALGTPDVTKALGELRQQSPGDVRATKSLDLKYGLGFLLQ